MKFIDEMRERSEEGRMALSAMVAGAVALVLFVLWGAFFFRGSGVVRMEGGSQVVSEPDISTDFSAAISEFGAQYEQIRQTLDARTFTSEIPTTTVVEISVDNDGTVEAQNVILGPTQE
mgnify:FL=1